MITQIRMLLCAAVFAVAIISVYPSCTAQKEMPVTDLSQQALIPKPVSVTATHTAFELTPETTIYIQGESDELRKNAQYLADRLKPATGFELAVQASAEESGVDSLDGIDSLVLVRKRHLPLINEVSQIRDIVSVVV